MQTAMQLALIQEEQYSDYRYDVIFKAYKWDPQVEDHNTVARHVLLMDTETADQLKQWAEQLARETVQMEEVLRKNLSLAKDLGLPGKTSKALKRLGNYDFNRHIRLMRFDFHPTDTGWAVSEVNSDVPGGLAEASVLPEIAGRYFPDYAPGTKVSESLLDAFQAKVKKNGTIALVHATSYADDRQVMQFIGDYLEKYGFRAVYAAPDHIKWIDQKAISLIAGEEGQVDGIIRFFPLEWLPNLPRRSHWERYYNGQTPACNHPIAMLTQSKRLPLIWDRLGVEVPAWKALLPETADPGTMGCDIRDWIYKPALGRVGENISIREVVSDKELKKIERAARRKPKEWLMQKRFRSQPLVGPKGDSYHLCIGVFTVDGRCAGFYGRISPYPRIDDKARDIPVLIAQKGSHDNGRFIDL